MSYNNNRGGGYRRQDSNASNRSGGRRGSRRSSVDPTKLPLEHGIICSLKESFGFIHCAERPEEIFFHYSEVANCHPDDLTVDTEVDFRVGQSERDPTKRAAYMINTLETGSVIWEIEEEPEKFYEGLIERQIRPDSRGSGGNRDRSSNMEGSIQVLLKSANLESTEKGNANEESTDKNNKGPMVRFRAGDYNSGNARSSRLFRGDLVRFRIFVDRRTKQKYARQITLLQTEKERSRQERERKLLENATQEEGMVISLNKGYGFLKTNRRRAHVYFHYSNLILPEDDFELKKGQEMKFLVVTETIDGQEKCSARKLECLPPGSVEFHTVVAKGIKGVITLCPQPPSAGNNPGYADDKDGSIRLLEPLLDKDKDGNDVSITDVSFEFNDAPGGVYTFQQRGTPTNGLWILEGDIVLFDVVKELADGSYQAAPTEHTLAIGGAVEKPSAESTPANASIRLAACSLVSRAEGTMHTLKIQGGYGFIHFAERAIDVHFHTYNLMPLELQSDLRKQLGYAGDEVHLQAGVGVHFDICAHGTVHAGRNGGGGGRGRRGSPHERENVKAHRILLLPAEAVPMEKVLAQGVQGTIRTADAKQLYAGFLDLKEHLEPMSLQERHPLVAKMIESFLEESAKSIGRKQLVFRDVLSIKDDDVVVEMVKILGKGILSYDHIPTPGMASHPGRLVVRRLEEGQDPPPAAEESKANTSKKQGQGKSASKNVRFDKSSLADELKEELPPSAGDTITCDVVQSRRTGKISIQNLKIVERSVISPNASATDSEITETPGVGVVQNVVPKSNFGFISVLDEKATRQELLYFNLAPDKQSKKLQVRKGDEVKFLIGIDPKSGKRMAKNIQTITKGTIPSKPSKNACRGIVLMDPSHTSLSDTPVRKKASNTSRWQNTKEDPHKVQAEIHEKGVILLLEDKTGMFSGNKRGRRKRSGSIDSMDSDDKSFDDASVDSTDQTDDELSVDSGISTDDEIDDFGKLLSHLPYKNGAIAIQGTGSGSGGVDTSGNPKRGDIVTFVKARKGKGLRDVRIEKRRAAVMIRGRLENIQVEDTGESKKNAGTAKFIALTEKEESYNVGLSELVSCDAVLLKDKQQVEGVLHEGSIYGICRTSDLYLESKLGKSHSERPKLNLTVKKNRGGKIMAQSMMAKGPDGTNGFAAGWTTRTSNYEEESG